jgi:protein arginine kinase
MSDKNDYVNIAISSRIRLARNLSNYPFPIIMDFAQGQSVIKEIRKIFMEESSEGFANRLDFIKVDKLDPIDKVALVEKHLISQELCAGKENVAVIIGYEGKISIMINEEDHLRIQCIFPGLDLDGAWNLCNKLDNLIQEKIDFAYDKKLGYLTSCPTNVGTGLRASVMLHLPCLSSTGYLKNILEACGKLGIAVRGMYGEKSGALGNMYQISNQVTLGLSEEEIIKNINDIAIQIIEQERNLQAELYKKNAYKFEDRVFRALGTLTNARVLTSEESFKLLSDLRQGLDLNLIEGIKAEDLNELTYKIQSANLQKLSGKSLSPEERDIKRAELVRECLKK